MSGNSFNKNIIILFFLLVSFILIHAQSSNENQYQYYCTFGRIELNVNITNELNDDILNNIISLNLNQLKNHTILILLEEEYQIFLFRVSNCTYQFLYDEELDSYLNHKLFLFSIEGKIESDSRVVKLVIQTDQKNNTKTIQRKILGRDINLSF